MPSTPPQVLSTGEKIGAISVALTATFNRIGTTLKYPFVKDVLPTLQRERAKEYTRELVTRCNVLQLQWLLPTSTAAYVKWIKTEAAKHSVPSAPRTEVIEEEDCKIHWIGHEAARKVIFFCHSGGFVLPLHPGHFNLATSFRNNVLEQKGTDVKIAILEYTLGPHAVYPTQFRQAIAALQHILAAGTSPADILICGDSAGGLLCTQILSHILHPYPTIPVVNLSVPFAGVLQMSPWVTFGGNTTPVQKLNLDFLTHEVVQYWGNCVKEGSQLQNGQDEQGGYWAYPMKAPSKWWDGIENVVNNVLITSGECEVLCDDIQRFGTGFKEAVGSRVEVEVVSEPNGIHIDPTMDALSGRKPTRLTETITKWVVERL